MAVVTPLNNPGGPEGDTVTVAEKLLNTEYCPLSPPKYSSAKCIWIGQLLAGVLFFFGSLLCGVL